MNAVSLAQGKAPTLAQLDRQIVRLQRDVNETAVRVRRRNALLGAGIPDLVTFSKQIGLSPDPWQERVLRSTAQQMLLNCSRQTGKSTTVATLVLHTAIYDPGTLSLLVCPTQRQSGEIMEKVKAGFRMLGDDIDLDADKESALQFTFDNHSRIVALPGAKPVNVRSYSAVKLLVLDEAAYVSDALYLTVRPMLAVSRGRLIAPSTPAGKRGWWWQEWEKGGDRWERHHVTVYECPRMPPEFIEDERAKGITYFEREFMGVFHEADDAAFRTGDIEAAFSEKVEQWDLLKGF